jgi:hypothetical protein
MAQCSYTGEQELDSGLFVSMLYHRAAILITS